MFDTALKYFTGEKYYKAERASWAEFFKGMGPSSEAIPIKAEADRLYKAICVERYIQYSEDPALKDFDNIVMIMSR